MQEEGDLDLLHAIAEWGQTTRWAKRGAANGPCPSMESRVAQILLSIRKNQDFHSCIKSVELISMGGTTGQQCP